MKLFVIDYTTTEDTHDCVFVAADDLPTITDARDILAAGSETDFTDTPTYIWELGQVWDRDGGMYEIKLQESRI